ncbi:hypothetical protein AMTRI_Chr04g187230 [Amborella trichopoda]|uniref:F-box domain-containing protein n=1 Tax=Amborella trichopoda TaxID=13333 RepID=W1P7H0_AMBTC|nr:transport inhibitor response 1-like protein [Amborella trichopoda]ERN02920.1 hypothetical protein AMTR_s00135p00080850 [Amborella trichopoda]|eukprot:XP_006841245.1 transport inhibitor response 1-like protein [Amborella trichopoda]
MTHDQPSAMSIDSDDNAPPDPSPAASAVGSTKQRPDLQAAFTDDVLESVLRFVTHRRDRNAVSLVSQAWYKVEARTRSEVFIGNCYAIEPERVAERFDRVRTLVLKGKPRFADFDLVPHNWGAHFSPWVRAIAQRGFQWLERVSLKRMSVTDEDIGVLARVFPGFKELSLVCCDGFSTKGLAVLAGGCRQLRGLELIEDDVVDDGVDWLACFPETTTSLVSLCFDCVECAVNFDALESLVARSRSLKKLTLNRHVSVGQLQRLMLRAPQLTHLGTGSFSPDPNAPDQEVDLVSAFNACKFLHCLSGFREILAEYLPAISPVCANLTSLNLSLADITAAELEAIVFQCHKLQLLWVLDSVRDRGLQAVASTCKDLRDLRVFPVDPREDSEGGVTEVGLVAISEGCRKLQSILYFCQQMTNAAVVTMSRNCSELTVFRLCIMGRHRPDHVTGEPMDEGFGAIVRYCKKLTRLAVSGLLTDRAFMNIGMYGKTVQTLSVAFAGDSDMALKYVLEGCPNLQKLEIRDSPFGDAGLLSGVHHYCNMRFLWMSSCRLTMSGCQEVARSLPHLVVEVIREREEQGDDDSVEKLYLYRSVSGPRNDAPPFVSIM